MFGSVILTPPSEEAMAHDIRMLKDCGFNMMRKHIKVEPRRYYARCDRRTVIGHGTQRQELKAMIANLKNAPSVIVWLAYNEGWSQPGSS